MKPEKREAYSRVEIKIAKKLHPAHSTSTTSSQIMSIIIRFRSKKGTFRVTIGDNDDFAVALNQLVQLLGAETVDVQLLSLGNSPSSPTKPAGDFCGKSVAQLSIKNGDMLFVTYQDNPQLVAESKAVVNESAAAKAPKVFPVDTLREKQDGLIPRKKGSYCRHGDKGMCDYCSPLPPYDKDYHAEQKIKHLSFYAHVKQLLAKRNAGSLYTAPLDQPNYCIDLKCSNGHRPYPHGICSKCQPSPITLQQQKFRMVDHVEFAHSGVVDTFIDAWRQTGCQRFGIMYGHYEPFDDVPLGIKAVVEAIVEPPQNDEADGILLQPEWPDEKSISELASTMGLVPVGQVFTDLTDAGQGDGTVVCKRHRDSYFLSCLEIIMAARAQLKHPLATLQSSSGYFLSKFVTCVITGSTKGLIEPMVYQVSTSAEALVEADMICATTQPSQMMVLESCDTRYVPDIMFSRINEYQREVRLDAKPHFPLDFLLVLLSSSFPKDPHPLFHQTGYAVENRFWEVQDLILMKRWLDSGSNALANMHFLIHLDHLGVLQRDEYETVAKFLKTGLQEEYARLLESEKWMTLLVILSQ